LEIKPVLILPVAEFKGHIIGPYELLDQGGTVLRSDGVIKHKLVPVLTVVTLEVIGRSRPQIISENVSIPTVGLLDLEHITVLARDLMIPLSMFKLWVELNFHIGPRSERMFRVLNVSAGTFLAEAACVPIQQVVPPFAEEHLWGFHLGGRDVT
jgi:hypothetical protein